MKPATTSQRGRKPVRRPIVEATSMNTAAMRTAKTKKNANPVERASTTASGLGAGSSRNSTPATSEPATAEAPKSIATKRMPLPSMTVAKKRSSRSPRWLLIAATNQRKAIPANGTTQADECDPAAVVLEVEVCDLLLARSRVWPDAYQEEGDDEEQGEHEARDAGGARRLEPVLDREAIFGVRLMASSNRSPPR